MGGRGAEKGWALRAAGRLTIAFGAAGLGPFAFRYNVLQGILQWLWCVVVARAIIRYIGGCCVFFWCSSGVLLGSSGVLLSY